MYESTRKLIELFKTVILPKEMCAALYVVYEVLITDGIVRQEEIKGGGGMAVGYWRMSPIWSYV